MANTFVLVLFHFFSHCVSVPVFCVCRRALCAAYMKNVRLFVGIIIINISAAALLLLSFILFSVAAFHFSYHCQWYKWWGVKTKCKPSYDTKSNEQTTTKTTTAGEVQSKGNECVCMSKKHHIQCNKVTMKTYFVVADREKMWETRHFVRPDHLSCVCDRDNSLGIFCCCCCVYKFEEKLSLLKYNIQTNSFFRHFSVPPIGIRIVCC